MKNQQDELQELNAVELELCDGGYASGISGSPTADAVWDGVKWTKINTP